MNKYFKKAKNILSNDGLEVFINRSIRYSIVKLKRISQKKDRNNISRFEELKGKYKGNRVFLLGNGPSLNRTPLHLLKNEYKMCCNRFNLFFERLDWFPDFYIAIDDLFIKDAYKEINTDVIPNVTLSFFPDIHPSNVEIKNKLIIDRENILWLNTDKPEFSLNLPKCGINKTVINVGLQVLAFIGFDEIYLLGMDMTFREQSVQKMNSRNWIAEKDDDPNHFDPRYFGKGRSYHNPTVHEMIDVFKEGKKFFKKHNVKIYNATIGGKLEVFPRKNFRDLFALNKEDELSIFLKKFNISKGRSNQIINYFEDIKIINFENEWNNTYKMILCDLELAINMIPKVIKNFIPFGPFIGQYLFIKRDNKI